MPEMIDSDSLQHDSTKNRQVVGERKRVTQPLRHFWHRLSWKHESGQKDVRHEKKYCELKRLDLRFHKRGDEQSNAKVGDDKCERKNEEQSHAPAHRDVEQDSSKNQDPRHLDVAHYDEWQKLAEHDVGFADGSDDELLECPFLALSNDRNARNHEKSQTEKEANESRYDVYGTP